VCLFGGLGGTCLDITAKGSYHPVREFTIRNVLLIDMINEITPQGIKPKDKQVLKSLDQISFTLNNSQKVIFADKGTYWDAQYIVDYYQHWYKDKRGFAEVDQYSNENWMVKYIGSNLQSRDLRYEYTSPSGSGYGDGFYVKKGDSYYLIVGGGASNGSIPDKNSVLTLTIKWDGKEESLKLRAVNQKFLRYLQTKSWEEIADETVK
jgi:hypothetical protein